MTPRLQIREGDAVEQMRTLPDACVQCCVTSPPYFGLRDYQVDGQIGLEKSPAEYVSKMVKVFREVRRLLKPDATLWLNLGDSYAGSGCGGNPADSKFQKQASNRGSEQFVKSKRMERGTGRWGGGNIPAPSGLKPKDLCMIPARVALALQADGWWLRQDIIWQKPNPMPESVTDRCTKAHEYIYLLTKRAKYLYDADAIREPCKDAEDDLRRMTQQKENNKSMPTDLVNGLRPKLQPFHNHENDLVVGNRIDFKMNHPNGANKRSVWSVNSHPYPEAHFATFPPDLIKPCILAGSRSGDLVLDPFAGSGTTGQVALELGRRALLIELNPDYVQLIRHRCDTTPGLPL